LNGIKRRGKKTERERERERGREEEGEEEEKEKYENRCVAIKLFKIGANYSNYFLIYEIY
jgi:hypothetical protein